MGIASGSSPMMSFPLPSRMGFICFQFALQNIIGPVPVYIIIWIFSIVDAWNAAAKIEYYSV
jgi:hypothetical protein